MALMIWVTGTFHRPGGAHSAPPSRPGVVYTRPWGSCIRPKTMKNGSVRLTGSSLPPVRKSLTGSSANARARLVAIAGRSAVVAGRTVTGIGCEP